MAISQKEREWLDDHFSKLREMISQLQVDVAALKVKAGIWGIIGGAIPVLITIVIYFLVRK